MKQIIVGRVARERLFSTRLQPSGLGVMLPQRLQRLSSSGLETVETVLHLRHRLHPAEAGC